MDAVSAVKEIFAAAFYLQEVHAMSQQIHEDAADMLGRLLGIVSSLDAIQKELQDGCFRDSGRLTLLQRLKDTVLAAEQLVSKLTGTNRRGVFAWAKGMWNAKSNTQDLEAMATRIDRAVSELTLSEVRNGFVHQVSRKLQGSRFGVQRQLQGTHTLKPENQKAETRNLKPEIPSIPGTPEPRQHATQIPKTKPGRAKQGDHQESAGSDQVLNPSS